MTTALAEADSARFAEVSVTVGATSVIVIVMTSVSVWEASSETCTVRSYSWWSRSRGRRRR